MIVVLDPTNLADIDRELWSFGRVVIVRSPERIVASTDAADVAVRRALARSGVHATETTTMDDPRPPLRPAIATTLAPIDGVAVRYDVLTLRAIGAGEATRVLLARPWPRRRRRSDVERCRDLLHDADRALAWRRVLWAEAPALRRRTPHLRPVVFDRDAVRRSVERWTFARDGNVGRWLAP